MITTKTDEQAERLKSKPISSKAFDVDDAMKGHLFRMLRKGIYSDPILACVREYICNAIDSNIEAGKTAAEVDVFLPNNFDECFVVRDRGVGLSHEDVLNVFCFYGSSTKRNTNKAIGCLGNWGLSRRSLIPTATP